jgi:hypothetical protein
MNTPARRAPLLIALGLALSLIGSAAMAILLGVRQSPTEVLAWVDQSTAQQMLSGFRGLERNQTNPYRWSFSNAAINSPPLARHAILLDLRLTSPRPADEPPADLRIARGTWQSPPISIQGDWRRYRILVPVRGYQPEISLLSTTFRPDDGDRRGLGVALSRFQLSIPSPFSRSLAGLAMLGPWHTALLLFLPLTTWMLGLILLRKRQLSLWLSLLPALLAVWLVYQFASEAIDLALFLPALWSPIGLLGAGMLGFLALQMHPLLQPFAHQQAQRWQQISNQPMWVSCGLAVLVGLLMVLIMPAWEHPDEASHFEFAWLLANQPTWPTPGTSDPRIAAIGGGGRALYHQPLYHLLLSMPLRLVSGFDLTIQLFVARLVSLSLFVIVIWCANAVVRLLTKPGHGLYWLLPLALVLNPTFANLMTSVNNDVLIAALAAGAIWLACHLLVGGWRWRWAIGLLLILLLAPLAKNTGVAISALILLVFLVVLWERRRWQWRWLLIGSGVAGGALLMFSLAWGDPAYWYRWGVSQGQPAQRAARPEAPFGEQVLSLNTSPIRDYTGLSQPIAGGSRLSNRTVTVGAWIWADRPASVWAPGVLYQVREDPTLGAGQHEILVDQQPKFVAFSFDLPGRLMFTHAMAWAVAPDQPDSPTVYLDGLVMAIGEFPDDQPPIMEPNQRRGTWGGRPFNNLIRNGDAEQGWFYAHPQLDSLLTRFVRRSPARIVAATADPFYIADLELRDYIPWMAFSSFGGAYGGRIFLLEPFWQYLITATVVLCVVGALRAGRHVGTLPRPQRVALITLALWAVSIWLLILILHTPPEFPGGIPSPRYGFSTMIPTTLFLVAGWLALWPLAQRRIAAGVLISLLALLSIHGVATIDHFAQTHCIREPQRCAFTPAPSLLDLLFKPSNDLPLR